MCDMKEEAGTKIDRLTAAMNRLSDGVEALVAQARKPHGEGHAGRFAGETDSLSSVALDGLTQDELFERCEGVRTFRGRLRSRESGNL